MTVVNIGDLSTFAEVGQSIDAAMEFQLQRSMRCYNECSEDQLMLVTQPATQKLGPMRARETRLRDIVSSQQHMMPFNSTPDASISRWLYGYTVMKQNQYVAIIMAMGAS